MFGTKYLASRLTNGISATMLLKPTNQRAHNTSRPSMAEQPRALDIVLGNIPLWARFKWAVLEVLAQKEPFVSYLVGIIVGPLISPLS